MRTRPAAVPFPFASSFSVSLLTALALLPLATACDGSSEGARRDASALAQFGQQDIDNGKTVVIAGPGGSRVVVLQQLVSSRACWRTNPGVPQTVDPLLLDFDFTGICARATDSNGYSVRVGGVDQAARYSVTLRRSGRELLLVGAERFQTRAPVFLIGRAADVSDTEWVRLVLEPGWRLTKRTYQGRMLGHFYFTNDASPESLLVSPDGTRPPTQPTPAPTPSRPEVTPRPSATPRPTPRPTARPGVGEPFTDIAQSPYAREIANAAKADLVSGFSNGTFQPNKALTREEGAALSVALLRTLPGVRVTLPRASASRAYSDVATTRWSAPVLAYVRAQGIASGYADGTFRPSQGLTRAEFVTLLRNTGNAALRGRGTDVESLVRNPRMFSDVSGHWARSAIESLSGVCNTASPLGERGDAFAPDAPARRDFAAAAALRLRTCLLGAQR